MNPITLISTSAVNLGIRSLSGYLQSKGYKTRCLFLDQPETRKYSGNTLNELERVCQDSEFVGISGITSSRDKTLQIIERLKATRHLVLVGGYDPSLAPEVYKSADYVCVGDGEEATLNLVKAFEKKQLPKERILPKTPVSDLNDLPREDYDNKNHLTIDENGRIVPLTGLLTYKNPRGETKDSLFYLASRGCPFSCTFCEEPVYLRESGIGKKVRSKDPERVVADVETLLEKYPQLKRVYFVDADFFSKSNEWIKTFSEQYAKRVKLPFWTFGSPSTISRQRLEQLTTAGLKEIELGIQSGSERTRREVYNRKASNEKIIEVMGLLKKFGVFPWIDIIYDNPWETRSDLLSTFDLLSRLPKPFQLGSLGLEFLPGTELTRRAKSEGKIDEFYDQHNFHNRKVRHSNEVYLNSLIRIMAGRCDDNSLGLVPISQIPTLTSPEIIDFMNQHTEFSGVLDQIIKSNSELVFTK